MGEEHGGGSQGITPRQLNPVKLACTMHLLVILDQARRRNAAEMYHAYLASAEGRAAALELERLRADCDAAEANYRATCVRHDAEREDRNA